MSNTNYVVCLKHGDKYGPEFVNVLHRMANRNLTIPFEFVCFTENSEGLDPEITVMQLPELAAAGWWYKPMFFNTNLGIDGTMLFLDLDVIVFRNIDNLFAYEPSKFCIIRDFNRVNTKHLTRINSSVFRITTGQFREVWDDFVKDVANTSRQFHGDQDWIYTKISKSSDFAYWPDEWIQSYKWEMRKKAPLIKDKNGRRDFKQPGSPTILNDTSIAVFHGDPNPDSCCDEWCKENWR